VIYLTQSQRLVLSSLRVRIRKYGYAPTVAEICEDTGLSSTSTVHRQLGELEKLGLIERRPRAQRAIKINLEKIGETVTRL
jgi:repressor LexA